MRTKKKGNTLTYTYKGNLSKEIDKCRVEEKKINADIGMYKWAYEKAKREYDAKVKRLDELSDFIKLGNEKLSEANNKGEQAGV